MDLFNEKIVKKDYEIKDFLFVIGVVLAGFILIYATLLTGMPMLVPIVITGAGYGMFRLIPNVSIEYEYIVTNGDLDIDKIIAKRKRVRIFAGESKDFEIIAKVNSERFTGEYKGITNKIEAVSNMKAENVYFLVTMYKGNRIIVYFEPNERMLQDIRKKSPGKVFM